MNEICVTIDGKLFKRGFWISVWKIKTEQGDILYHVRKTGSIASNIAASQINKMLADLNPRGSRGTLLENLRGHTFEKMTFKMFAYGPIYDEQETSDAHQVHRTKMAAITMAINILLISNGFTVSRVNQSFRDATSDELEIAEHIYHKAIRL